MRCRAWSNPSWFSCATMPRTKRPPRLDLVELLRSIADDYADIGTEVTYSGPQHLAFPGRPIGLRRAFGNLVDNAVKYGVRPSIDLQRRSNDVKVTITDRGPGIPDGALHDVFTPFQRLEPSRNRHNRRDGPRPRLCPGWLPRSRRRDNPGKCGNRWPACHRHPPASPDIPLIHPGTPRQPHDPHPSLIPTRRLQITPAAAAPEFRPLRL